jgi:hypothetical protein
MEKKQKNRDLRNSEVQPFIHHSIKRVKPGSDYFTGTFSALLVLFVYSLLFFRNVTGESHNAGLSAANL